MCNGSQMGSAGTSSSEQVDITKTAYVLKVRGGVERDSKGKKAGKGPLIRENQALTLGVSQDQTLFVPKPLNTRGGCCSIDEKMGNTYIWEEQANTLASRDYKQPQAVAYERREALTEEVEYDVRRLTPIECARLQGFPPDWCADVSHSDSAEYKLWGNGIALPSILPMMQNAVRLVEEYKENNK